MKIQNLSIIFLVITIPLILILSYYLNLQQETLKLQAEYDTKLAEATKEGIKAFEINTIDWLRKGNVERKNTIAMINAFITSLSNNLNVSGTAKEFMANYIPAVAVTTYDGYYTYAPAHTLVNKENDNGEQLYKDATNANLVATTSDGNGANFILFEAEEGQGENYTYIYKDENGNERTQQYTNLTTDEEKAKEEYKHILGSKIAYSAKYKSGNLDAIVNYTLDNRIYIYYTEDNKFREKDGYLVYFDSNTILPKIKIEGEKEKDITVKESIEDTKYCKIVKNNDATEIKQETKIEPETLTEQILYKDASGNEILGTFKYVYDIESKKLYYDEAEENFFILNDSTRTFIAEDINVGDNGSKYKSVSVLKDDGKEYIKIYQFLNAGTEQGNWYINLKPDDEETIKSDYEEVDTQIEEKLDELGLKEIKIWQDCSAINYYVESYVFTKWVEENLGRTIKLQKINYDSENKEYKDYDLSGVFDISIDNDPENEESLFVQHKKEIMKEHITTNLNLAISNYGMGEYKLPVLSDSEWQQVFSNISMITFLQGMPIGLKYYNNYAIATSTANREYVDPGEIYFSGNGDPNYHRVYCSQCGQEVTGYRSIEYTLKEYKQKNDATGDETIRYYYKHDNQDNTDSETACYYCIVNRANYAQISNETDAAEKTYYQAKAYNEALARERYYQNEQIINKAYTDLIISVNKKKLSITNTDIIFILDASESMNTNNRIGRLKNTLTSILDTMITGGLSSNYFIGFIKFSDTATNFVNMTENSQLNTIKDVIGNSLTASGGTNYQAAFKKAIELIDNELSTRENHRVIIFLADGEPSAYDRAKITELKNDKQVDELYIIAYDIDPNHVPYELEDMSNIFATNSKLLNANAGNIEEKFKDILYRINPSGYEEVETEGGRLDISGVDVSEKKPIKIIISQNGINKQTIEITEYPTSDEGIIIKDGEKIFLSIEGLANECGITDFEGVDISIEYFVKQ